MVSVIERVLGNLDGGAYRSRAHIERIAISSDDLARRIMRLHTSVGDLGLRLANDLRVRDGDVIYDDGAHAIALEVEAETVLVAHPAGVAQALALAHALGNRHLPVQVEGERLVVRDDRLVEELMRVQGVAYSREQRALAAPFRHAHAPHGHDDAPAADETSRTHAAQFARLAMLTDSTFPSGAFSHSYGLETAIADSRVCDGPSLEAWLATYLRAAFATLDARALVLALRGGDVLELDAVVTAATLASEVRAANGRIARALCDSLSATDLANVAHDANAKQFASERLAYYRTSLESGRAAGVPSLVYALAYAALGVDEATAVAAFASSMLAALAGVGSRAIPLGQRATTRALWNLRAAIDTTDRIALAVRDTKDLRAQAFDHEIDALDHRHLDGRLFAS
jgi:urease accessory protein UreF